MAVTLATRSDITLEAVRRVGWGAEPVRIAPEALARMDACHASLRALVEERVAEDPGALIYGMTTAPGDGAAVPLTAEVGARRPTRLWTAASFGEPLPERVVRAIVLARLANFLDGHAAARAEVAVAVAGMLDGGALPAVPGQGSGGAGEILALGHLFFGVSEDLELSPKELMALINGSPCAAALAADVAIAGRGRLALAEQVCALSAEALGAPLEAYSADLEALWGDEHETQALQALRALLAGGTPERQAFQAPVSFRILPRVLGHLRRAQAQAEQAAATSLRSVTDNPVYIPPDEERPLGAIFSTGGYHDARAPAAIDALAAAWADLCQLAQRHTDKLVQHPATASLLMQDEWTLKPLHMVTTGWAEEARSLATPSLLSLGGFGQNDTPAMSFVAWRKAEAIGRCLDAALAVVAVMASQVLATPGRTVPPALEELLAEVRRGFPPLDGVRRLGLDCDEVAQGFTRRVFAVSR